MAQLDDCADKTVLLDIYHQANLDYSEAVAGLQQLLRAITPREYQEAYESTEELRLAAHTAQQMLIRHVTDHGC